MPLTPVQNSQQANKQTSSSRTLCDLDSYSRFRHLRCACDSPLDCLSLRLMSLTIVLMMSQMGGSCSKKQQQHQRPDTSSHHLSESVRSIRSTCSLQEKDCYYIYLHLAFFTFLDLLDPSDKPPATFWRPSTTSFIRMVVKTFTVLLLLLVSE